MPPVLSLPEKIPERVGACASGIWEGRAAAHKILHTMKPKIRLFALFLSAACAILLRAQPTVLLLPKTARPIVAVPKSDTELRMERQGLVEIASVDSTIRVSLMYARPDNFTGRVLYTDIRRAYLHPEAAEALHRAQAELRRLRPDLSLKVFDAARPMAVQQRMYDVVRGTPKNIYVSNPRNGGGLHNYGLAVDITLCTVATGDTLPMGTAIDYMGRAAHVSAEAEMLRAGRLSHEAVANRRLLRRVMAAGGFRVLSTEWWHFNLRTRAEARARYKVVR